MRKLLNQEYVYNFNKNTHTTKQGQELRQRDHMGSMIYRWKYHIPWKVS